MTARSGWYASMNDLQMQRAYPAIWQPTLQAGDRIDEFEIFFDTKEACEDWIRTKIIDQGWYGTPDEPLVRLDLTECDISMQITTFHGRERSVHIGLPLMQSADLMRELPDFKDYEIIVRKRS